MDDESTVPGSSLVLVRQMAALRELLGLLAYYVGVMLLIVVDDTIRTPFLKLVYPYDRILCYALLIMPLLTLSLREALRAGSPAKLRRGLQVTCEGPAAQTLGRLWLRKAVAITQTILFLWLLIDLQAKLRTLFSGTAPLSSLLGPQLPCLIAIALLNLKIVYADWHWQPLADRLTGCQVVPAPARAKPKRSPWPTFLQLVLTLLMLPLCRNMFLGSRETAAPIRANMALLRNMVTSYQVDHQAYPADVATLEREAKTRQYWRDLSNPIHQTWLIFESGPPNPALQDAAQPRAAGAVIYTPLRDAKGVVRDFRLEAYDRTGKPIDEQGGEASPGPW